MSKSLTFLCLSLLTLFAPLTSQEGLKCETVTTLFSPDDHLADALISRIDAESYSIKIAVFCFTHRGIADALIRAKKRGVDVEMIIDPFSVKKNTPIARLHRNGIRILVWNSPSDDQFSAKGRRPLMHDKFCVFNHSSVWTGSFNFTWEGDVHNRENAVILDSKSIAKEFLDQFAAIEAKGSLSYDDYLLLKLKNQKRAVGRPNAK